MHTSKRTALNSACFDPEKKPFSRHPMTPTDGASRTEGEAAMTKRSRREALMQDRVETSEVKRELGRIDDMTVQQLRDRYREVYDEDTRSRNRQYLIKKLKWRIQELAEGGLSELARRKIAELARNAPIRRRLLALVPSAETASGVVLPVTASKPAGASPIAPTPPRHRDVRLPPPGTVIRRMHNDVAHDVRIVETGAEYGGAHYGSLSGVARAITGTNWNGFLFFADALTAAGGGAKP
jgi:hypothetical protein